MSDTITLPADQALRLLALVKAETRARQDAELAALSAKVAVVTAARERQAYLEQLAEEHGFDTEARWHVTRTGLVAVESPS